jgi:hypothetical protein
MMHFSPEYIHCLSLYAAMYSPTCRRVSNFELQIRADYFRHICKTAYNSSRRAEWIFIKFYIGVF